MPVYEYSDPDTGVKVEIRRAVEDRNKPIVLRRSSTVPDRIAIFGFEPSPGDQFDDKILKAYHKKEERDGSRFNGNGFTKNQIKETWTNKRWKHDERRP